MLFRTTHKHPLSVTATSYATRTSSRLLAEVQRQLGKQQVPRAVQGGKGIRKRSLRTRPGASGNQQESSLKRQETFVPVSNQKGEKEEPHTN